MSEDLQKPPVVDLELLLQPISGDSPSGENLRYSGIYDEISEARRADDGLNQGDWQSEMKVADFRKVIGIAVPALTSQAKDLQVAAWLSEALIKEYGITGLRDSLKMMSGLQANFWDTLHPEIDEGDMEGRANAVAWMDTQGALALKQAPIIDGGHSFFDWEDSKRFHMPDNFESLDPEQQQRISDDLRLAEKEGRTTSDEWKKALARTRRAFAESINFGLDECRAAMDELNGIIEEKYDRNQMPSLTNLYKALDNVHTQAKKVLDQKRIEEPDPVDDAGYENGESADGDAAYASGSGGVSVGGSVQNRRDALKRLDEIAAFFQKTEPHSPVAYLVQRAVKWGNMPLDGWLQDVIKDEAVLGALRETLGLGSSGFSSTSDDSGWSSETSSEETSSSAEEW